MGLDGETRRSSINTKRKGHSASCSFCARDATRPTAMLLQTAIRGAGIAIPCGVRPRSARATTITRTHTTTHHDPSPLVHTSRQHVSSPNISARPITPHTQLSMTHTHPIQPHTTQCKSPRHIMGTQNTLSSAITSHHRPAGQTTNFDLYSTQNPFESS